MRPSSALLRSRRLFAVLAACIPAAIASGQGCPDVGFDAGSDCGWFGVQGNDGFGGGTFMRDAGGNPAWHLHTVFQDFGIGFFNQSDPAWVGDWTRFRQVTVSIDVKVDSISFFGQSVARPWLVEFRDVDGATGGYPWNSAWFRFGTISAATHGSWMTFSVTFDPRSAALPAGWRGSGAEDPATYEPVLPAGVAFRDVMRGVDTVAFTTLQPGMFFGFTDHSVRVDNIRVTGLLAADLDGNGSVGGSDLGVVLGAWGTGPGPADINLDGRVDGQDLGIVLGQWTG